MEITPHVRKFVVLFALIAVVVGGWTVAWFWMRGTILAEMDTALAAMAAEGTEVSCPDRSATGWPFRMEIACAAPIASTRDGRVIRAKAVAATWHIVDPKMVLAFAEGPVVVEGGGGASLVATFETLRASLRLEDLETGRVSLEVATPKISVNSDAADSASLAELSAERLEAHVRPTPGQTDSLDLAATILAFGGLAGENDILPGSANAGIAATLSRVSLLGTPEGGRAWAAAGGTLTISEATLAVGDTRISAKGAGTVGPDGAATATLDAIATNIAWLTAAAQEGKPLPPALAALGSAFLLLGRPMEGEGDPKALTIAVDEGAVSANGLAIVTLPSVFDAAP
ncbi:MAG TPA: DUF2125 domain-containing protein [Methylomirabilota bacterium]|nr:DUF2125 domain-containing protein [Methylomirabilota bacterium]